MMISPLSHVRVLDMTRILAGPYCTMLLGDLGAQVLKVERPGVGDDTRTWQPPAVKGESCYFMCVNRNKQSLAINMKSRQGQALVQQLAAQSDVLVENFLPGALDRLNLGPTQLRAKYPQLIYTSITGYGQTGPWSRKGGYDVIAAAVGGLLHMTGAKDGEPCKPGVALTDLLTGLYAHGAILAALMHRDKTGEGQHIDCNLLSTQISTLVNIGANYLNAGQEAERWGTAHASIVPYQAFRTSDGRYFVVGGGNDTLFAELCNRIGRPDLPDDTRFTTNDKRVQHRRELIDILEKIFAQRSLNDWVNLFADSSMPNGPVNTMHDAFNNEQVLYNNMVQTVEHSTAGQIKLTAPAVQFSSIDNRIRSAPPALGEHTAEVLQELLQLSTTELADLRKNRVIDYPDPQLARQSG